MNSIEVRYFALFREKAGKESELVQGCFKTHAELYEHLSLKYSFGIPARMIQVAVDDEFSQMSGTLLPSSKIVFIPPVAGG